jgi:O-antigen/teichoic acid export membrane protein
MNVFYALATIFVTLNLHSAFQTYYFDYNHDQGQLSEYFRSIFSFAFFFAIISSCCLILLGPVIFRLIFSSGDISFYPDGLIVVISAALVALNRIYYVLLRNQENLKKYGTLVLGSLLANVTFQILFVLALNWGISGALFGYLLSNLMVLLLVVFRNNVLSTFKFAQIRDAVNYSLWFLPFLFIQWFLAKGDRMIIENFVGLVEVGIYALLFNVSMIISLVSSSILMSIRPTLFNEFKIMSGKLNPRLKQLFIYYSLIIGGTATVIFILVQNIEKFDIPAKYYDIRAYILLALVLFSIRVITRFFYEYLTYLKKSRDLTVFSVINLSLFLFLIIINVNTLTLTLLLEILIICNLILLIVTVSRCYYLFKVNFKHASD